MQTKTRIDENSIIFRSNQVGVSDLSIALPQQMLQDGVDAGEPTFDLDHVHLMEQSVLIQNLTFSVSGPEGSVLISGPSSMGKSAIIRVLAGLWSFPFGKVIRPLKVHTAVAPCLTALIIIWIACFNHWKLFSFFRLDPVGSFLCHNNHIWPKAHCVKTSFILTSNQNLPVMKICSSFWNKSAWDILSRGGDSTRYQFFAFLYLSIYIYILKTKCFIPSCFCLDCDRSWTGMLFCLEVKRNASALHVCYFTSLASLCSMKSPPLWILHPKIGACKPVCLMASLSYQCPLDRINGSIISNFCNLPQTQIMDTL